MRCAGCGADGPIRTPRTAALHRESPQLEYTMVPARENRPSCRRGAADAVVRESTPSPRRRVRFFSVVARTDDSGVPIDVHAGCSLWQTSTSTVTYAIAARRWRLKSTFSKASYHCGNSEDLYACRSLIAEIAVKHSRHLNRTRCRASRKRTRPSISSRAASASGAS